MANNNAKTPPQMVAAASSFQATPVIARL